MATDGVWHVYHCRPLFFPSAVLPVVCPVCQQPLDRTVSPVTLPSPFRSAASCPRSVLLRPTVGEFVEYRGGDLHVGVSDANGDVVAFDVDGLRRCPATEWTQCLVIPFPARDRGNGSGHNTGAGASEVAEDNVRNSASSQTLDELVKGKLWDEAIASSLSCNDWPADSYNEKSRNCFSFLLSFLDRVEALPAPGPWTKERFAEEYVLPVSRRAAKYLTLKRRVDREGWYAIEEPNGVAEKRGGTEES